MIDFERLKITALAFWQFTWQCFW